MPRKAICKLRGKLAFDHDLVAADVDDVEHLLVLGTGQTSMQAPQVVQAHAASGERANLSRSGCGLGVFFSNGAAPEGERRFVWEARSLSSIRLLISSADWC